MSYPFVQAAFDYGPRPYPTLGLMLHMAEGGGTVGYLDDKGAPPERGVSVHAVCEYSGRVVQMLDWTHASGSLNPDDRSVDTGYYGHSALVAVLGDRWTDPNKVVLSMEIEGHAADGPNNAQIAAAVGWGLDMKRLFPSLRGALGHTDQTDTKPCPGLSAGMKAIFAGVGGHGLWGVNEMRFVKAIEGKLLPVVENDHWLYVDGSEGGTFHTAGHPPVVGLIDGHTGQYLVRIGTGKPYADGKMRQTDVLVRSSRALIDAPAPAPVDCAQAVSDGKAAQHEADRARAIELAGQL